MLTVVAYATEKVSTFLVSTTPAAPVQLLRGYEHNRVSDSSNDADSRRRVPADGSLGRQQV